MIPSVLRERERERERYLKYAGAHTYGFKTTWKRDGTH